MTFEEMADTALYFDNNGQTQKANKLYGELLVLAKTKILFKENTKNKGIIGKAFLFMLEQNIATNQDDLQLIVEVAYYYLTQAITAKGGINPEYLFDRIVLIYNGEDFVLDIIKKVYDLRVSFIDSNSSPRLIQIKSRQYLEKMRVSDFETEPKVYKTNNFLQEKKSELDGLIQNKVLGVYLSKEDIIAEGKVTHQKVFDYIQQKFAN